MGYLGQVLPALESAQCGLYDIESMSCRGVVCNFLSKLDQATLFNSLINLTGYLQHKQFAASKQELKGAGAAAGHQVKRTPVNEFHRLKY